MMGDEEYEQEMQNMGAEEAGKGLSRAPAGQIGMNAPHLIDDDEDEEDYDVWGED